MAECGAVRRWRIPHPSLRHQSRTEVKRAADPTSAGRAVGGSPYTLPRGRALRFAGLSLPRRCHRRISTASRGSAAARKMLESGRHPPKCVAVQCGFANADTPRRASVRHVGITRSNIARATRRLEPCAGKCPNLFQLANASSE